MVINKIRTVDCLINVNRKFGVFATQSFNIVIFSSKTKLFHDYMIIYLKNLHIQLFSQSTRKND